MNPIHRNMMIILKKIHCLYNLALQVVEQIEETSTSIVKYLGQISGMMRGR